MSFVPKKQAYSANIHTVTLGTGDHSVVIGGQNVLPFYSFDAPIEHSPKIGIEISDLAARWTSPGIREFYRGCTTMADFAQRAETMEGADFLALHFESADPSGMNRSVEACVADAEAVAKVCTMPLAIMGCKNSEKDTALFAGISEALRGQNILLLSAREEDYKAIASAGISCGQLIGAETADDVNLAKQLNILLQSMSVGADQIVMNIGTAAVGYGYEYVASTFDRVRAAALAQGDEDLRMPIVAPVSPDSWSVKESLATEQDEPAWGSQEERAIDMEISTAAANLTGGADAVIMRHPAAVAAIHQFIAELI